MSFLAAYNPNTDAKCFINSNYIVSVEDKNDRKEEDDKYDVILNDGRKVVIVRSELIKRLPISL